MALYLRYQLGLMISGQELDQEHDSLGFFQSQMLMSPMLMQASASCSLERLSGWGDLHQGFTFYQGDSNTIFQQSPEKIIEQP